MLNYKVKLKLYRNNKKNNNIELHVQDDSLDPLLRVLHEEE